MLSAVVQRVDRGRRVGLERPQQCHQPSRRHVIADPQIGRPADSDAGDQGFIIRVAIVGDEIARDPDVIQALAALEAPFVELMAKIAQQQAIVFEQVLRSLRRRMAAR